jgi:hypothetical protein
MSVTSSCWRTTLWRVGEGWVNSVGRHTYRLLYYGEGNTGIDGTVVVALPGVVLFDLLLGEALASAGQRGRRTRTFMSPSSRMRSCVSRMRTAYARGTEAGWMKGALREEWRTVVGSLPPGATAEGVGLGLG